MIEPIRSEDIQTYSEVRANFAEVLKRVRETNRPTFITNHGKTAGVLLSPEAYDALAEQVEFAETVASLRRGIAEAEARKGRDYREALKDIAAKLGLNLNR